jgi:hypothetical protein
MSLAVGAMYPSAFSDEIHMITSSGWYDGG